MRKDEATPEQWERYKKRQNDYYHNRSDYRKRVIEQANKWEREHREEHKIHDRKSQLERLYGLSYEDLRNLWLAQGGLCPICERALFPSKLIAYEGETKNPNWWMVVDHIGEKGQPNFRVRGLLHSCCNRLLGDAHDNSQNLQRAIEYLSKSSL